MVLIISFNFGYRWWSKFFTTTNPNIVSSHTVNSPPHDWIAELKRSPIDEITEISKPKDIIVVGTIRCLQSEQSWHSMSCRTCNRKVTPIDDLDFITVSCKNTKNDPYYCKEVCNMFTTDVVPRFKVQIRVQDDSGSISHILFDWDVSQLINKTASNLFDRIDNPEDYEMFPGELDVLINKKVCLRSKFHLTISKKISTFTPFASCLMTLRSYKKFLAKSIPIKKQCLKLRLDLLMITVHKDISH